MISDLCVYIYYSETQLLILLYNYKIVRAPGLQFTQSCLKSGPEGFTNVVTYINK